MARKYSHQLITAISFSLTSGVIAAIGMIVGLYAATTSKLVIVAGITIMAIADGLADAAGIHLSEESEMERRQSKHTHREVWMTTLFTFFFEAGTVITFVIPVLILSLETAVFVGIGWGMLLLVFLNYYLARIKRENPIKTILEHILLAVALILVSGWVGTVIAQLLR